MENEQVKALIAKAYQDCEIIVTGDGSHFDATVVSEQFSGMSSVKKQQAVYATVTEEITSGAIHALSIKTYTPDEWKKAQSLSVS
jgi:acid stress-induced BolA-like protein IbaG/YrbA